MTNFRVVLTSLSLSLILVLITTWLTSGHFSPVAGKSTLAGAVILLPAIAAIKLDLSGVVAKLFEFFIFFGLSVFLLLVVRLKTSGKKS